MKPLYIFCEGVTDQFFIADCIEKFYGYEFNRTVEGIGKNSGQKRYKVSCEGINIIEVGGCTNLDTEIFRSMMTNHEGTNIVIFDADQNSDGNKGFIKCQNTLEAMRINRSLEFDYYLWPNHKDDGIIENLLREMVPPHKEVLFQCIENHKLCISSLPFKTNIPSLKETVNFYAYLSLQKHSPTDRNYQNPEFWNLDYENISALRQLRCFLNKYLPL